MVAGFSTGAYYALTLALQHPDLFRGTVAFSPIYDREEMDKLLPGAKEKGFRAYLVAGLTDPYVWGGPAYWLWLEEIFGVTHPLDPAEPARTAP